MRKETDEIIEDLLLKHTSGFKGIHNHNRLMTMEQKRAFIKDMDKILSLFEKKIDSAKDSIAKEIHDRGNFWNWTPPVGFAQDIINIIKSKIKE